MADPIHDREDLAQVSPLGPDRTVERALARELRSAIIAERLRPGTRLRYRELAAQFNVSVTPVRIALTELAQEGLVEMRTHGGARVAPLSIGELEDLYAARAGYEGWLAWQGARRLTDADITEMDRCLTLVEEAAEGGDPTQYLRSAWAHRSVCYRAANRPTLLERVETLFERSARYNWLSLKEHKHFSGSLEEAREFNLACHDRDGERTRDAIRQALDRALEYFVDRMADELDPDSLESPGSE